LIKKIIKTHFKNPRMFVLDTNVISELRPSKKNQSPDVRKWAAKQSTSDLYISAITVFELEVGIQALENKSPPQGSALRRWLLDIRSTFHNRILPFTEITAPICAKLHIPNPRSSHDAMIAATAIEHGFTVVTRNDLDFVQTGVKLINPWYA
jgi:toxin FitB